MIGVSTFLKWILPRSAFIFFRSAHYQRQRTISQMGQDFWVFGEVFNEMKGGFFLEVGSADGMSFSNTFLLEKRYQWRGICIEANVLVFGDLRKVRNAKCLNVCVDSAEREVEFVQNDLYSGVIADDTDNRKGNRDSGNAAIVRVSTRTLASILTTENAPRIIDYLSIDVEGSEDRILCGFPFETYTFNCITVERPKSGLRETLARNGYIQVKEIPNHDVFYVHRSFYAQYEKNIFSFWARRLR